MVIYVLVRHQVGRIREDCPSIVITKDDRIRDQDQQNTPTLLSLTGNAASRSDWNQLNSNGTEATANTHCDAAPLIKVDQSEVPCPRILLLQYHPRNGLYWLAEKITAGTTLVVYGVCSFAVTICPGTKIRRKAMNFTADFYQFIDFEGSRENLDKDSFVYFRLERLLAILQICDEFFHAGSLEFSESYAQTGIDFDIVDIIRNMSVPIFDIILSCRVNGMYCEELFAETLTEEGICFSFNGFSSHDMFHEGVLHDEYSYLYETENVTGWTSEDGFRARKNFASYPVRALGSGFGAGLSMELATLEENIEHHCRVQQGFKVIIHSAAEYPQVSKSFALVPFSRDVTIAVRPVIMQTSSELQEYPPHRRNCFFEYERQLKFFRVYTQSNCELECITNYTLKMCGCVKFSMPRSPGTRVCQTSEISCVLKAGNRMLRQSAKQRMKQQQSWGSACDCIPGCSTIHYDTELTQSKCDFKKTLGLRFTPLVPGIKEDIDKCEISQLSIYFKEVQYIVSRRSALFRLVDFISNCGGILGLCLGVSLFSIVELLYYCLVRPLRLVRESMTDKQDVIIVKESAKSRF
ncbi:pickpocket protein 28-like [Armigeres subalbatus]|uniref:pickpocket protein 28-like n=1 Tax=Armigeres subalbatus TaxID=124917 RepID=UPI002ED52E0C